MKQRVLLVEDHSLVRSGFRTLLDASLEVSVVGETDGGRKALELCRELEPNIVLCDVEMRELNGIETARQIHAARPDIKVIMLSMYGDAQYVLEAIRAGAVGYVLKDAAFAELLTAITVVASGKRYLSPPLSDLVTEDYVRRVKGEHSPSELDKLSSREREILQLVAEGYSTPQVAKLLYLSIRTVDSHRFNIMQKLEIHSIAGLTKFAINNGLTSLH